MARRRRSDHWLNTHWWILTLGEWIGLVLALGAIVSLLCILLIRRHTLDASSPIIIRRIRCEWTEPIGAVTGAFWWWMDESHSPAELVLPNAGAGMLRTRSTGAMSSYASADRWWQSCNQLSSNTGRKRAVRN